MVYRTIILLIKYFSFKIGYEPYELINYEVVPN